MADRTIAFAPNGRHSLRGLSQLNPQEFLAYAHEADDRPYVFDFGAFFDGDNIASVVRRGAGVTSSVESNTATRITQRLKGFGYMDFTITSAGGVVGSLRVYIEPRSSAMYARRCAYC